MFNLTRQEQIVIIFLLGAVFLGLGSLYYRTFHLKQVEPVIVSSEEKISSQIVVDISGAVWRPGVYTLPLGARVNDLMDKARARQNADLAALNLAARLRDGQKIVVPTKTERQENKLSSSYSQKLNLNTATLQELETLPSIGPARAQAIISYRTQQGKFQNIEEIKNIKGIGEGIFERIKELITAY